MQTLSSVLIFLCLTLYAQCEVETDGTLGPKQSLTGPNFVVGQNLGQTAGHNLFHSFSTFNLTHGQSVTFAGATYITNIISRITGGPSSIDGSIRSSIAGANLYLLNPAGLIFGPNATLDLSGSFHVSTADYLRLGLSDRFYASPLQSHLLSSAAPEAFGFLGHNGSLQVHGAKLSVGAGKTLGLSANGLTVDNATQLKSVQGTIALASVKTNELDLTQYATKGYKSALNVTKNSLIEVNGDGGGNIYIRGGKVVLSRSRINNFNAGAKAGGVTDIVANKLDFKNNSYVSSLSNSSGSGANISLVADRVDISTNSSVLADTSRLKMTGIDGNAGNIKIVAKTVSLNNGNIQSNSLVGNGRSGSISINADSMSLTNGSVISNNKIGAGVGKSGTTTLNINKTLRLNASQITSETVIGMINGGKLEISCEHLQLQNHSAIYSSSRGLGQAGEITINSQSASVLSGSYISSSSLSLGNGGTICLNVNGNLTVDGSYTTSDGLNTFNSLILSRAKASGNGGDIIINSASLTLSNGGTISAASEGTALPGDAGTVTVNSNYTRLINNGKITTESLGAAGGQIVVNSSGYLVLVKSGISTRVHNGSGNAGDILLNGGNLVLNHSIVRADAQGGNGGNIFATVSTIMQNYGSLFDASSKLGLSGNLVLSAPEVDINQDTEELVTEFLPAEDWVNDAARARLGNLSSFVVRYKKGVIPDLWDLLPSTLELVPKLTHQPSEALKKLFKFDQKSDQSAGEAKR